MIFFFKQYFSILHNEKWDEGVKKKNIKTGGVSGTLWAWRGSREIGFDTGHRGVWGHSLLKDDLSSLEFVLLIYRSLKGKVVPVSWLEKS